MQAHIFIASLAFLLDRALEKKLKSAGIALSSQEAWQALRTVRVVDIDLGGGKQKRSVTQGSHGAARILRTVGIKDLDPDSRKARRGSPYSDTAKNPVLYFQQLTSRPRKHGLAS